MMVGVYNRLLVTQMTSLPVECGPGGTGYTSLINSSVLSAVTHIWHPYVLHYDSVSPTVLLLCFFLIYIHDLQCLWSFFPSNLEDQTQLFCGNYLTKYHAQTLTSSKHAAPEKFTALLVDSWVRSLDWRDEKMEASQWRRKAVLDPVLQLAERYWQKRLNVSALHATTGSGKVSKW